MRWSGYVGTALAFFLVGAGAHTTQTAGLALASDIAPEHARPRVVAMMYLTLLVGTVVSALVLGRLLEHYSPIRLIQVIQGAAVVTMALNTFCLWKQEARQRGVTPYEKHERRPLFRDAWRTFTRGGRAVRLLTAVGLGFFAFNLQDVLLEPYGGEILHQTVGQTTSLTGIMAMGAILAFWLAAKALEAGRDAVRLAAYGALLGVVAFACVIFAAPLESAPLFRGGTFLIGMGEGLFGVGHAVGDHGAQGQPGARHGPGRMGRRLRHGRGAGARRERHHQGRRGASRGEGCARRRLQPARRCPTVSCTTSRSRRSSPRSLPSDPSWRLHA